MLKSLFAHQAERLKLSKWGPEAWAASAEARRQRAGGKEPPPISTKGRFKEYRTEHLRSFFGPKRVKAMQDQGSKGGYYHFIVPKGGKEYAIHNTGTGTWLVGKPTKEDRSIADEPFSRKG
jgi:hypothetical protein